MAKVMLIEDDRVMNELVRVLLEMEGHQVALLSGMNTLKNILKEIRRELPDIILLDVHIYGHNGFDLLSMIRKDRTVKNIQVIITSGYPLMQESNQSGADDFLLKPYMPDELFEKINFAVAKCG